MNTRMTPRLIRCIEKIFQRHSKRDLMTIVPLNAAPGEQGQFRKGLTDIGLWYKQALPDGSYTTRLVLDIEK